MKKTNSSVTIYSVLTLLLLVASIALTAAVAVADVQPIGPEGTKVGLATINGLTFDRIGTNALCDKLCDGLLVGAFGICLAFVVGAIVQAKRYGAAKIDRTILYFFGACVVLLALYVAFEQVTINYRPVVEDGVLKASFPSSHTMATCGVFGCAAVACGQLFRPKKATVLATVCVVVIIATLILRIVSGVHWLTDVFAGFLFAMTVVCAYAALVAKAQKAQKRRVRGKHAR